MRSWHEPRRRIVSFERIEHKDRGHDEVRGTLRSRHPICVKALLTKAWKRVSAVHFSDMKRTTENMPCCLERQRMLLQRFPFMPRRRRLVDH